MYQESLVYLQADITEIFKVIGLVLQLTTTAAEAQLNTLRVRGTPIFAFVKIFTGQNFLLHLFFTNLPLNADLQFPKPETVFENPG